MHANRNKKAVKRVEKGMMKANRIRNLFAVFAIVLTTFMITTVFSLGINYMENMKLMQVRTAGTTLMRPFLRWQRGFVYDILQYIVTGLFLYERSI